MTGTFGGPRSEIPVISQIVPARCEFVVYAPAPIVSMVVFQDRVLVATKDHVFELIDGVFHPMVFVAPTAKPAD